MSGRPKSFRPWCKLCGGRGIRKVSRQINTYIVCECGRMLDSWAQGKMAEQAKLAKRLEEVKEGKW